MKKNNIRKLFSIVAVLALVLTAALGAFIGCKPKNPPSDDHVCGHVCPECGKCTDTTCTDPVCADKCGGHNQPPAIREGKTYYVTADAKTTGADGSKENPYNIYTLLNDFNVEGRRTLGAGDTVYVMPGTYKLTDRIIISASGAYNNGIKIINAAYDANSGYNEADKRVVLDFSAMEFASTARGVSIYGDYVYWYGIDVCGAGDNGMFIAGSYNTIEYCEFYNNRDTGLQLGREASEQLTVNEWPSYNLIKNCTSHNNYDNETYGENADGFAAKLTVGYGNVFDGCIAYRNSDDGWDLYAKSDSGNIGAVIMYNCVAFENGYIEYTQQEYNKLFPTWTGDFSEEEGSKYGANSYLTRDGDGNGFKLGGSIMEGDVVMYNCLSYGNRMHGVTDNSNPGVINLTGVTSYNNSAVVDDNPESERFGQIVDVVLDTDAASDSFGKLVPARNSDTHGNIDVARQTYSYNNIDKVLSVKDGFANSLDADAYRGAVTDSILLGASKGNVINGSIDASTKEGGKAYTSQINSLVSSDIFAKLPIEKTVDGETVTYTYNLSGLKDLGTYGEDGKLTLSATRVHLKYRNADGSVNMGDILAVKDYSKLLGNDKKIGSVLNLAKYADYTHFADEKLAGTAASEIAAMLAKAKESLTIGVDANACYQDFDVLTKMIDCFVSWSSSNNQIIKLNEQLDVSVSNTEYVRAEVTRPTDKDAKVTLTATISYLNQSVQKVFEITVKTDAPAIGDVYVTVAETGEVIDNGGRLIIDINRQYAEPVVSVENAAYYNGTLLTSSQYNVKSTYKYAATDSSEDKDFVEINGYNANVAGVYKITHTVTLANDAASSKQFTYKVYVASTSAQVDFLEGATLTVNRDGYIISGALNSVTGTLYSLSSSTPLDVTADTIKTATGVKSYDFRDTSVNFQFANDNNGAYHVYYALANVKGEITSQVYHSEIKVVEISTHEDFVKMAGGIAINGEVPSETIYTLTKCLDFTGKTYTVGTEAFKGLLNGKGHTVSNVTVDKASNSVGLFYKVEGGTIENIKFDNIVLNGKQKVGVIAESYGGYFYNIALTRVSASGDQRVGGLIGQVYEGAIPTYVDQVSLVNPLPAINSDGSVADSNEGTVYAISSTGNRAAGIIGFIQPRSSMNGDLIVYVNNCYASSYITAQKDAMSSIVSEYDGSNAANSDYAFRLEITNCLSDSIIVGTGSSSRIGGMLGYHKGTGVLRITNCLSMGRHFFGAAEILDCQKNASGIVGNYATNADAIVQGCYATMEEHNTSFNVQANSKRYYLRITAYNYMEWDLENTWTYTEGQGVTLNFLGEWTCACGADQAE